MSKENVKEISSELLVTNEKEGFVFCPEHRIFYEKPNESEDYRTDDMDDVDMLMHRMSQKALLGDSDCPMCQQRSMTQLLSRPMVTSEEHQQHERYRETRELFSKIRSTTGRSSLIEVKGMEE